MNHNQQTTLWLGAFRYYLGRRTYAVSDFCELLIQEWPTLNDDAKNIIQRELEEAFDRDERDRDNFPQVGSKIWVLGDDCDRFQWEKVRRLWNEN